MRPLDVVVSVVVLFVFAVAQPLLDLLGRNAEFFIARSAPPADIVLLAVLIAVVIPLAIGFALLALQRVHEFASWVVHTVVLTVLAGVAGVAVH